MPLVTIIVPVYNTDKYIQVCIDSILSQTFWDFELLLVDDGSTDNSGNICDYYEKIDSRVRVFHTVNKGSAMARNVGIDNAKGDLISMIDSDDYVPPSYLNTLVSIMRETDADIVGHMFKAFKEDNEVRGIDIPPYSLKNLRIMNKEEALEELVLRYTTSLNSPCKLYKKKVFNVFRYPSVRKNDDEWAIHHLVANSNKTVLLKERIYFYRPISNSQTRTFSLDNYSGVLAQLDRAKLIDAEGLTSLCDIAYRNYFLKAIRFYYKCKKYNFNARRVISRDQRELNKAYKKCHFSDQVDLYSKRDMIALFLFSKKILLFSVYTKLLHIEIE